MILKRKVRKRMHKPSKPSTNSHECTNIGPTIRLFVAFHSWMVFIVGNIAL
jgi:hypothetical protein